MQSLKISGWCDSGLAPKLGIYKGCVVAKGDVKTRQRCKIVAGRRGSLRRLAANKNEMSRWQWCNIANLCRTVLGPTSASAVNGGAKSYSRGYLSAQCPAR
ncbi:MAG: RNA-binding S4 domain-containing protein [Sodalis sp. (in: enterobacteria)]